MTIREKARQAAEEWLLPTYAHPVADAVAVAVLQELRTLTWNYTTLGVQGEIDRLLAECAAPAPHKQESAEEKWAFDNGSGITETMTAMEMIAEIQRLGKRCEELYAPAEPQTPEPPKLVCSRCFQTCHPGDTCCENCGAEFPMPPHSSPEPQAPLEPGRYGTCAGHPSQLVECGYCRSKVAPRDPFHVHGHTECLCGTSPRHNSYLHDRDGRDKRTMIDLAADGKFLANCIKESIEMKNTNVAKLEAMTDSVMELIRPWIKEGAVPDLRYGITRALDSAVSMGGWEKKPTTPNRDNTLAQRLCHEETGLMGDPETAEKVAAWVLLNYTVRDRQTSNACDHEWIDIGASVSRCRKCEQLAAETGWLLEGQIAGQTVYWHGWTGGHGDIITYDANKAIRFARKVDAEKAIPFVLGNVTMTAIEHLWMAAPAVEFAAAHAALASEARPETAQTTD